MKNGKINKREREAPMNGTENGARGISSDVERERERERERWRFNEEQHPEKEWTAR